MSPVVVQELTLMLLFNFVLCSSSYFALVTSSPTRIKSYIIPVTKIKGKTSLSDAHVRAVTLSQPLAATTYTSYTFREANLKAPQIHDAILPQSVAPLQPVASIESNYLPESSPSSSASLIKPVAALPSSSVTSLNPLKKGKSFRKGRFLASRKKVRIFKLLTNIVGGNNDDDYDDPKTSKTAKIIGDVTGEIIGLVVTDRFRLLGELVGDLARENVRDALVASLDSVFKNIISVRNK